MTIPNQWYYVKNNERCGPVDPAQLKQLADAGKIERGSLVWRVGMADWVEAEQVKGLFPEPEQPGSPNLAINSQVTPGTQPPPSLQATPALQVTPTPQATPAAASPEIKGEKTLASDEAAVKIVQAEPKRSEPRKPVLRKKNSSQLHPIGMMLDMLHAKVTGSFVDASVQLFTKIGFWAILAYSLLILIGSLVASLQTGQYWQLGFGVGVCVLAITLQYPAIKMLELLESWKFEAKVPRPFFDTIAIFAILAGVGLLISLTLLALKLGAYPIIFTSIAAFIVFIHLATAALSLPSEGDVSEEKKSAEAEEVGHSTAEEARSLFGGLLVIFIKTVPVVFGVGISLACLELLYSMMSLRSADDSVVFTMTALYGAAWTLGYLLLPALVYLVSVALRVVGAALISCADQLRR